MGSLFRHDSIRNVKNHVLAITDTEPESVQFIRKVVEYVPEFRWQPSKTMEYDLEFRQQPS